MTLISIFRLIFFQVIFKDSKIIAVSLWEEHFVDKLKGAQFSLYLVKFMRNTEYHFYQINRVALFYGTEHFVR